MFLERSAMSVRTFFLLPFALLACKDQPAQVPPPTPLPPQAAPRELNAKDVISMVKLPEGPGDLYAIFHTSRGDITVKLFEKEAPKTVQNFVGLATGQSDWIDPRNGQK